MVCLGEKDAGSQADLPWQSYRGTAVHGLWIVSLSGLFSSHRPGLHHTRVTLITGSARQQVTALDPSTKEAFKPMVSSKKMFIFSNGSSLSLCRELCQVGWTAYGLNPIRTQAHHWRCWVRLTGASFRLTKNLDFVKGKDCHNPFFLILMTKYTCWKSEQFNWFKITLMI